jgi:hypothetical protein
MLPLVILRIVARVLCGGGCVLLAIEVASEIHLPCSSSFFGKIDVRSEPAAVCERADAA